ncbi:MAG TPA: hypothetical protein VKG25_01555 [Bryobacteraceae bacterium]|nr:hypothetical protein [Bryobacteraceae bacterium]
MNEKLPSKKAGIHGPSPGAEQRQPHAQQGQQEVNPRIVRLQEMKREMMRENEPYLGDRNHGSGDRRPQTSEHKNTRCGRDQGHR